MEKDFESVLSEVVAGYNEQNGYAGDVDKEVRTCGNEVHIPLAPADDDAANALEDIEDVVEFVTCALDGDISFVIDYDGTLGSEVSAESEAEVAEVCGCFNALMRATYGEAKVKLSAFTVDLTKFDADERGAWDAYSKYLGKDSPKWLRVVA